MRLSVFFLLLFVAQTFATNTYSQETRLTFKMQGAKVIDILNKIENESQYYFLFNQKMVDVERQISLEVKNESIDKILTRIFENTNVSYLVKDRQIVLTTATNSYTNEPQQKSVSGKVTDSSGLPLPGVSVVIKGTTNGTITDAEGNYSLANVPTNAILQFSFVGMKTQEIAVGGKTSINISLADETIGIEEVVAVGYGTQKKVSTTSPISQMKGEEMARRPVTNAQQSLQGLAPGVTILDGGGVPGRSAATLRVRGITTLSGNNDPLILIDGIEQSMDDINPSDIDNVSILKDAASTAIYGSRAANGVVLVTTKRGKKDQVSITYSGYVAMQQANNKPEHMGLEDYLRYQNMAYTNVGMTAPYSEDLIKTWVSSDDRITYPLPNDWFNILYKDAPQFDQNLSFAGGSEKIQGRASIRWQEQNGIITSVFNKGKEARVNLDFNPTKKLKISADINYRQSYSRNSAPVGGTTSIWHYLYHGSQWAVPLYPDGTYGISKQGNSPLLYNDLGGYDKLNKGTLVTNLKLDYEIIPRLKFNGQYSLRSNNNAQKIFNNTLQIYDYATKKTLLKNVDKNMLNEIRENIEETTITTLLNYEKNFAKNQIKLLAGYSEIYNKQSYLKGYREYFYNNDIQSISMGSDNNKNITGYDSEWGLKSYFGRANYIYNEKYIFEANARWDGSSRFTGPNVYAFFPSVSGAWRISQENFWNKNSKIINDLKLRASWGKSGNQAIPLYEFYPALISASYTFSDKLAQGYLQKNMANADLTWETTTQTNIGFDSQWFNQKVTFNFDWYKKTTDGILLTLPIPGVIGLNPPKQNAGVVENKGVELMVSYKGKSKDWRWDVSGNLAYNKNEITSLAGTGPYITTSAVDPMTIRAEGLPIDANWGYKVDGFFQSAAEVNSYPTLFANTKPGDTKYVDLNNDGKITPADMTYLGNSFPNYTFGFTSTLAYKNFELFWQWQGAADVAVRLSGALSEMGNQEGFTHKLYTNNVWTPENTDARFPRPTKFSLNNVQTSEMLIHDGSYLRLKTLQLAYSLPKNLLAKTFIKSARFTISGTNLLTISKLNEWNLDPEFPSGRAAYYPQTSVYSLGFNFQF
jgi:TonB-linked SusC/RagA family outer membrane protein